MSDPVWPTSLPQRPLVDGYSNSFGDGAVRTDMDSGPPKARRRFTAAVQPLRLAFRLTAAQVATLRSFFKDDCAFGAIPFSFVEPVSGASIRAAFSKPPAIAPRSAIRFDATIELDWLPG
jgi:hypothetical protein